MPDEHLLQYQVTSPSLDRLVAALETAPQIAKEEIGVAIEEGLGFIEGEVATRTPVDTGHLRDNLFYALQQLRGVVSFHPVGYEVPVETGVRGRVYNYHIQGQIYVGVGARMMGRTVEDRAVIERLDSIFDEAGERIAQQIVGGAS